METVEHSLISYMSRSIPLPLNINPRLLTALALLIAAFRFPSALKLLKNRQATQANILETFMRTSTEFIS